MEYYVLKHGTTKGPFTEAEVVDQLIDGRFSPEDLGQVEGAKYWTRLRRLFDNEESDSSSDSEVDEEEVAEVRSQMLPRTFSAAIQQWWDNVFSNTQRLFEQFPLEAGAASLALGCALMLLSHVPIFIIGPVLIGALFGGGLAMLRGRVMAGLALCAASIFVPALIWATFFWAGHILSLVGR